MIDPGLRNRVVLVTGANSGIGAAIARGFGRLGAIVAIHYLESQATPTDASPLLHTVSGAQAAEAVANDIRLAGGRALLISADLAEEDSPVRILDTVESKAGPVDILVNNAAHCESADTIFDITSGRLRRHFAVNTYAAVMLVHEFASRFKKRGASSGRIINISTDGARAFAGQIAYGASKAATEAFTRSTAIELGPLGITVNAVAPGPVQTGWITDELDALVTPSIPLRRVGTPQEIADAVIFFASRQADWITGQIIQVAGGHAL